MISLLFGLPSHIGSRPQTIWMLITLGIVIAIFMFAFGVGFGLRGNIPESIAGFLPSPTNTDIVDQSALSQEAIL